MILKKYRLKDGSIYFHKLYFSLVPKWMTKYSPPFGDYNYAAYLYQPHKYFIALYDQAKWFIQRGYRGYAECDVWSIDWYLTKWMPEALRILHKTKHGTPVGMTVKGWDTRLLGIIDGFVAAREIQEMRHRYRGAENRAAWRRFNKGMRLFHECFFNLWD